MDQSLLNPPDPVPAGRVFRIDSYASVRRLSYNWNFPKTLSDMPTIAGIDPGSRNMGLAVIRHGKVLLYQIEVTATQDSVERIQSVLQATTTLIQANPEIDWLYVEQAAYNMPFGQTTLAEARSAAIVAALATKIPHIEVLPPKTWRKRAFGNGNTKAEDVWPTLPKDASSALGIALAAIQTWENKQPDEQETSED